jgi:hypothetical protein
MKPCGIFQVPLLLSKSGNRLFCKAMTVGHIFLLQSEKTGVLWISMVHSYGHVTENITSKFITVLKQLKDKWHSNCFLGNI